MPSLDVRHPDWERMWSRWMQARAFLLGGVHVVDPEYTINRGPRPVSGVDLSPSTSQPVEGERQRSIYETAARGAARSFLWQHDRETAEEFADRSRRLYHLGIFRGVINVYAAGILKTPPRREATGEPWARYDGNVDGRRTRIDTFCRRALTLALAYGRCHAITDRRPPAELPRSAADADRAPAPYSYLVSPLDVVDWVLDERGEFVWLVTREDAPDERQPGSAAKLTRNQYRIWTRTECALWRERDRGDIPATMVTAAAVAESDFEQIGEAVKHGLGRVPCSTLWATEEDRPRSMACESAFSSLLDLDRHVLNKLSELDETERAQTFSLLGVPVTEGGPKAEISVGPFRAFTYDASAGGAPSYISPDGALPDGKWKRLESQIQMARTLEGASRGRAEYSKEERSAASLTVESEDKRNRMTWWAAAVEEFDEQLHRDVGLWERAPYEEPAAYVKDFDFRAISAQVQDIVALKGAGLPPLASAELTKQVAQAILREGGASAETIQRVVEALDAEAKKPQTVEVAVDYGGSVPPRRATVPMREQRTQEEVRP